MHESHSTCKLDRVVRYFCYVLSVPVVSVAALIFLDPPHSYSRWLSHGRIRSLAPAALPTSYIFSQAGKGFLGMLGLAFDVHMLGEGHVER